MRGTHGDKDPYPDSPRVYPPEDTRLDREGGKEVTGELGWPGESLVKTTIFRWQTGWGRGDERLTVRDGDTLKDLRRSCEKYGQRRSEDESTPVPTFVPRLEPIGIVTLILWVGSGTKIPSSSEDISSKFYNLVYLEWISFLIKF